MLVYFGKTIQIQTRIMLHIYFKVLRISEIWKVIMGMLFY